MMREQGRRGQPVLFLGLLLAGWVLLRVVTWQPPWTVLQSAPPGTQAVSLASLARPQASDGASAEAQIASSRLPRQAFGAGYMVERPMFEPAPRPLSPTGHDNHFAPGQRAAGHSLLWLAGMAALPMPHEIGAALMRSATAPKDASPALSTEERQDKRWRVDAWLLLRDGASAQISGGDRPASYGASQFGAVLAYRLAPSSRRDPAAYVRASKALVNAGETELAIGLRARPLAQLPISAHAEVRAIQLADATQIRPAAFVSGGFDEDELPLGLSASGYLQAGAVGGEFASGFVDGALRIDRKLVGAESARIDAGLGAWGGAQRGAARLDVGPSAALTLEIGGAPARIAADWRFRVAGNAEPSSGAAITLSTGF